MMRPTIRIADDERISDAVLDALSAASGTDPLELPPLHDAIDLDALDRLFPRGDDRSQRPDGRITFVAAGCEVCVTANGRVVVIPQQSEPATRATSTG